MKNFFQITAAFCVILLASCSDKKVEPGTYVDLNTGDSIMVVADPETGYAINSDTKKPVYLYVNNRQDTIFTTGVVVNNKITRNEDGFWEVDGGKIEIKEEGDVTIKYADYKKKVDDGDYKIKEGDYKLKVEEDGDMKLKDGDYKRKVEEDGDIKIKDGDSKTKIEDGVVTKQKN